MYLLSCPMELTIDQALQQGVAAHKEGKLQEAEKLYRAILGSQPQHPDANHNLEVLAVGVGKLQESLRFRSPFMLGERFHLASQTSVF